MDGNLVGREEELAAVERLLAGARARFSALLFEGEAGIGKTAVFHEAVHLAEASGFHVLACRPGASEAMLSLAGVCDLLAGVPADVWAELPAPQRHALDVALLRIEPGERPVEQRAVAAGLRSLVTALAGDRPVLVAVDDVQWLDAASATILAFVVRRLGPEPVGMLATRRPSELARLDVATIVPPESLARRTLAPLSLGALQWTLAHRLGVVYPRSTLLRVHRTSRGNPLFALEIGRLLADRGTTPGDEPLPVPEEIRELVRARVGALPASTREVLLAAALLAHRDLETLTRALGRPLEPDLKPAERAGIAARDGEVIAFVHPLHAAAVVALAAEAERKRMHRTLAETLHDPEERARHLALGSDGPNEAAARLVEEAAFYARARGALHSAAELLESARTLTPPSQRSAAAGRAIRAAELHLHGGDRGRARALLETLLSAELASPQRAESLRLLAELSFGEDDLAEAEALLLQSIAIDDHPRRSAPTFLDLMYVLGTRRMDFGSAAELGRRVLQSLEDSDDPLLAEALAYAAMTDFLAGNGVDWEKVERALAVAEAGRMGQLGLPARAVAGLLFLYTGRHAEAREILESVRRQLAERGDEADVAQLLVWLSWLETRSGDFNAAARLADEAIACAALAGHRSMQRWATAQRGYVHAHHGEIDEARTLAAEAERLDEGGVAVVALWVAAARALTHLSEGTPEPAWEACRQLVEGVEQSGLGEPVPLFFLPDALEALVTVGQLDRAEPLVRQLERRGRQLDRAWALAVGGRCRGLLLAARGDLGGALAALDRALIEHERLEMPFDRARTLLVKGVTERRLRRRTPARKALEEAASEFGRLGARRWADRARSELDRLGGRPRAGEGELTPSERRVVELAADGLSNKAIAAELVISVHTVEVHLSRAYAKLAVRSRAQLARRLSTTD